MTGDAEALSMRSAPPRPGGDGAGAGSWDGWFTTFAETLLNACDLVVGGAVYRLAEVEAYFFDATHPDPFTHRDPRQRQCGRWYFHRTGGRLRGGSFKGLDLTLGDDTAYFAWLIRAVVADSRDEAGACGLIDGPSRTVDRLLGATGSRAVADLDARVAGRSVWDRDSPLYLRLTSVRRAARVYRTARVGLSVGRAGADPEAWRFFGRPYRFLTEPRGLRKGRAALVLSLHQRGERPDAIARLTGCPRAVVERYVAAFEAGCSAWQQAAGGEAGPGLVVGMETVRGKRLTPSGLCRLLGAWAAEFGRVGEFG